MLDWSAQATAKLMCLGESNALDARETNPVNRQHGTSPSMTLERITDGDITNGSPSSSLRPPEAMACSSPEKGTGGKCRSITMQPGCVGFAFHMDQPALRQQHNHSDNTCLFGNRILSIWGLEAPHNCRLWLVVQRKRNDSIWMASAAMQETCTKGRDTYHWCALPQSGGYSQLKDGKEGVDWIHWRGIQCSMVAPRTSGVFCWDAHLLNR
ncbi:unnamed protein product [Ostreobium quekettii]|uniref:Uncharacterized protein n=1 Tax=Ostreobium quekettii TaxID=121088 RepID=A0A8S1IR93_9CHLO|nr:unnamed protein product [Ostreobium quekettii]